MKDIFIYNSVLQTMIFKLTIKQHF